MDRQKKNQLLVAALVASGMFGATLAQDYVTSLNEETLNKMSRLYQIEQSPVQQVKDQSGEFTIVAETEEGYPQIRKKANHC